MIHTYKYIYAQPITPHCAKFEAKFEAKARRSFFTATWQTRPMRWLRVVGSFKL